MNKIDTIDPVEDAEGYWNIDIQPLGSMFDLKLLDVWHYRDLFWLLVRRDFVSFYKQTVLGPLWFFVQPLFTTFIYSYIFGSLAGIATDGIPRPLFYIAGITWWNYFSECLNRTASVFRENAHVFGKVYFPRMIMPLSIVCSSLIKFAVQILMLLFFMLWYAITDGTFHMNSYALLFPVLVLLMALQGLGLGMIVSSLTTKYRDLIFLVGFGVQLLMYGTTVVYPLSAAPQQYKWLISINPITPILEAFRYGFFGAGSFSWESLGLSALITLIITFIGVIIFSKVERTFIDTV
ncbi:ABC transporter permease [Mucilaginibacter robiniae]|uniref:Transport permease protein n=1 Tax=Mucilaginibacter robiniae TaxID=2728022 RepID=A0A7L5E3F0_9SPHI|nr:ABC transporter permease [Mucilaginibacter robiniae]QJD97541.1 ABC transporter permease [Mucilaginibacter robiniae]